MFKALPEYVVFYGGTFYARCDTAGDKVTIPKDVFTALPSDTRLAFKKLSPFSYFDSSGQSAQPALAPPAPPVKKPPKQQQKPKPDKPKSATVLAATSVGSSTQIAGSVPEAASPPSGSAMGYDPRFLAHYPHGHHPMYAPPPYGPSFVPYGAPLAPPVHFNPPAQQQPVVFGAPPDPYASYRAPVQFQNSSQAFFAAPVQHQLGQHSVAAVRPGTSDGSGGSGGSGGGYQGSSSPSQQQFSRSGKQLLLTDGQGPWY